jgi:hypothetical protein
MSLVMSIVGIVVCGALGGVFAWAIVATLGWTGTFGALIAAVLGMVAAFLFWVGATSLIRAFGWIR